MPQLTLSILPEIFAVCRLTADADIPTWALSGSIFGITRTRDELSIVCLDNLAPQDMQAERGWRAFKVEGPLDFALTGILASIATPLAAHEISIFAISTYDTDYILVKKENLQKASIVLGEFCKIV